MKCELCLDDNVSADHEISERHLKNKVLAEYSANRKQLTGNRKGFHVACNVKSSFIDISNCTEAKIKISVRLNEELKFKFTITNDTKKDKVSVLLVQIPQNKLNFTMNEHRMKLGSDPITIQPKQTLKDDIFVKFKSSHIGQYEMPILFSFRKEETKENVVIIRDMVVYVENEELVHEKVFSPYAKKEVTAPKLIKTTMRNSNDINDFLIPKNYKTIYASALYVKKDASPEVKELTEDLTDVFKTGATKDNYVRFFHNLLWYEETIVRINLKNYNMSGVPLVDQKTSFLLFVPGLAEKRPSLMLGDLLFVKRQKDEVMYEAAITEINENNINIKGLDRKFFNNHTEASRYDIRFFMSRMPLERMHLAVDTVLNEGHEPRVFPVENNNICKTTPILDYYNLLVEENPEQRIAVEHIVAGTAGLAPYLLHGPPGTGKTVTIVEAILQIVAKNEENRILVCTDSNMAADNVATMLIKYTHFFDSEKLILRANSKFRVWETMPESLKEYSNGTSYNNFEPVSIEDFLEYRIIVTTLSHSAKFAKDFKLKRRQRPITHLFVDEAAQASEPACLIPVAGMLRAGGRLVLAGDPHQLGPVTVSANARRLGLGLSLMERLMKTSPLYSDEKADPNYVVMLRNNFRSDEDILEIPNELFYKKQLRVCAKPDKLSRIDILGEKKNSRAIVFHGVLSKEQKVGKSPSYFNTMELEILQMYLHRLVKEHRVKPEDIGIVTPYIRQVYKIKIWLQSNNLAKVEVGTVEAFQGKEKRVILISTVRANCGLLDHDAKFQLGFLVDDKRFNVALTRAKAKAIIIGNPLCLEKDAKWRKYIERCRELGTHCGFDSRDMIDASTQREIIDRITPMLKELNIAKRKV